MYDAEDSYHKLPEKEIGKGIVCFLSKNTDFLEKQQNALTVP